MRWKILITVLAVLIILGGALFFVVNQENQPQIPQVPQSPESQESSMSEEEFTSILAEKVPEILINEMFLPYDETTESFLLSAHESEFQKLSLKVEHEFPPEVQVSIGNNVIKDSKTVFMGQREPGNTMKLLFQAGKHSKEIPIILTPLPVIDIHTDAEIVDEPKIGAQFRIFDSVSGDKLKTLETLGGIETRGATAQEYEKKSFDVELWEDEEGDKKHDAALVGLRKDDDWVLDAMWVDGSRMRNKVSNDLWLDIANLHYASKEPDAVGGSRGQYVEVILNGRYHGLYVLQEPIDRKQLEIKKPKKSPEGMLYKSTGLEEGTSTFEAYSDFDSESDEWEDFEQKYPDTIHWGPLHSLVSFVVDSTDETFRSEVSRKFDLANARDYYLFLNLIHGVDNNASNLYVSRYQRGERFFYTPWDLDSTWGVDALGNELLENTLLTNRLFDRLIDTNVAGFKNGLKKNWIKLRNTQFSEEQLTARFEVYRKLLEESGAIDRENARWPEAQINLDTQIKSLRSWINNRLKYMDAHFENGE